jgi:hypothetical protein
MQQCLGPSHLGSRPALIGKQVAAKSLGHPPNVCRSEYHLQALYSGVNGPMRKGNGASLEMALNISATMRNLSKLNRICTIYELLQASSVCQWPHCLCTNSARSARPTATSQWREVRTIQKRLVIRIWKRCKCRQYKLYASCASIFTDKICDDPHGFGKKVTESVFAPQNAFERSLVDWDMDGPVDVSHRVGS